MSKLLILFALFIFLLLPTCYNFGEIILDKVKIKFNDYLKIFIGFIGIVVSFQLLYYPAMVLQLSSKYLLIFGFLLTILLIIIDIKKISNFKKIYLNKWIWGILFISCVVFFIYMRSMPHDFWYFDDSFYLPLMYENADTLSLYTIEPRSGDVIGKISSLYTTQGFYMIGSFLIEVYNILKGFINFEFNYLAIIYYFMAFPAFLMLVTSMVGIAKQITTKTWKKILFVCLYIYSVIFLMTDSNILNNMAMNGYIGVFTSLTIHIPFVVYLIFEYIKGKKENVYLISLMFFAMLSYASFNIFIIFILLYTLLSILYITKKEKKLNHFMIMILPAFLFLPPFIISNNILAFVAQLLIVIIYALYFKFNNKILKIEKPLFKILKYFVIGFAIIPVIGSILLITIKYQINCSTTEYLTVLVNTLFPVFGDMDLHYSYYIITAFDFLLILLVMYLLIFRKKETNMPIIYICIILAVFLNPLSIVFISTMLTSETYNRVFILILNPYIYYLIASYFIDKIDKKKIIIGMIILFTLICILVQLKEFNYWIGVTGGSNKFYRMRDSDVIAEQKLSNYAKEHGIKKINLASTHTDMKIINPEIYSLLDRTLKYEPDETFTKRAYYIAFLYHIEKGEVRQEYYEMYNSDPIKVLKDLDINFITLERDCSVKKEEDNQTPNVLCEKPKADSQNDFDYKNMVSEYNNDKKIYEEFVSKLELVHQTERYTIYHIKEGE